MSGYTCWQFGKNCVSCLSDVEGFGRKRTARNGNRQERTYLNLFFEPALTPAFDWWAAQRDIHRNGRPIHMLNMCLALRRQARCRARAINFILRMCNTLLVQSATHAARARASVPNSAHSNSVVSSRKDNTGQGWRCSHWEGEK